MLSENLPRDIAHGDEVRVGPDEPVFGALCTLPMGWSWALYFCHAVTARAMVLALVSGFGMDAYDAERQLIVDGRPAPRLGPGRPVLAPYVDNANALCWDDADAELFCRHCHRGAPQLRARTPNRGQKRTDLGNSRPRVPRQ